MPLWPYAILRPSRSMSRWAFQALRVAGLALFMEYWAFKARFDPWLTCDDM